MRFLSHSALESLLCIFYISINRYYMREELINHSNTSCKTMIPQNKAETRYQITLDSLETVPSV